MADNTQDLSRVERHFVTFYSPGTFVNETSSYPIESWDVEKAIAMARDVVERYNARPYGFRFSTRSRGPEDLDSAKAAESRFYWLGGTVLTVADIEARNDPRDSGLLSNMRGNGWDRVVQNDNSWRWTQPLMDGDVVLDVDLRAVAS